MSELVRAIRYLTIVPMPARASRRTPGALGRAAGWFPVVGLGLGVLLVLVDRVMMRMLPPLPVAVLIVVAWKVVTGGLHLDGLADCLDGLAGRDRAHRLAIMRDSRIGTFGAAGLVLFLMLEVAAVAELPPSVRWRVLLVAPAIARVAPPVLARLFGAARTEGQGAAFVASVSRLGAVAGGGHRAARGVRRAGRRPAWSRWRSRWGRSSPPRRSWPAGSAASPATCSAPPSRARSWSCS